MNCRVFEKNLEDYLQGGLDFAGRFGMERHARQCIRCGKDMADALQLSRMTHELRRVKAPSSFESSVLEEIAKRKSQGGLSFIRRFWIYGIEWPSWQKSAMATLSLAVLGFVFFSLYRQVVPDREPAPSLITIQPAIIKHESNPGTNSVAVVPEPARTVKTPSLTAAAMPPRPVKKVLVPDLESTETEYIEHLVAGPDNRPVIIRLPKKIRMQYSQASEEYFIRNVSH